jgi:hypothetical protein
MTITAKIGSLSATMLIAMVAATLNGGCSSSSSPADAPTDSGAAVPDDAGGVSPDADFDSAPKGCVYPAGPYGITPGKVLNPNLQWQGFAPGATTASTVKITDLYDCDGSKGINAFVIDSAGQWCVACQYVAQDIPTWFSPTGDDWTKLGIQILTLVIQNNNYEPATITTAQQWRSLFKLTDIYVVADPADTFPTTSLPYELLVDPRTMKITMDISEDTTLNKDGSDPNVTALAKKNGAK